MESLREVTLLDCDFCFELRGGEPRLLGLPKRREARRVFQSSENSISVLADASPVLPGHSLLIPQDHVPRFTLGNPAAVSAALKGFIERTPIGGNVVFFEHGGFSCLRNGLCSEHAHLHVLPALNVSMQDLLKAVRSRGGDWSRRYHSVSQIYQDHLGREASDYLVLGVASPTQGVDVRRIYFESVKSQILRFVLAESIGSEPHISSPERRWAAFRATCEMLGERWPAAAPVSSSHERVITASKQECIGCAHDCVRKVSVRSSDEPRLLA